MEQDLIQKAAERVRSMEAAFDTLRQAVNTDPTSVCADPSLRELLRSLTRYYESGQWLCDYELDEQGLFLRELKRGVLSQDAVYDLLAKISEP